LSLFQNSVSFEKALEKLFKRTIFSIKFKVDFPKTEVLKNSQLTFLFLKSFTQNMPFGIGNTKHFLQNMPFGI